MKTKETSTKEQASKWFASKTYLEQHELSDKYFESRNPSLLTIEQVEEIWIKENNIDEDLEIWDNVHKPNQKQFKEFNPELFKAYIDKLPKNSLYSCKQIIDEKLKE